MKAARRDAKIAAAQAARRKRLASDRTPMRKLWMRFGDWLHPVPSSKEHKHRKPPRPLTGGVAYVPTRRERHGKPHIYSSNGKMDALTRHHGALRGGRAYFVTDARSRLKVSRWLRPDLRCH